MALRIWIFSITMDADNSFYVKFIATEAPTFFGYIVSVLAMVMQLKEFKVALKNPVILFLLQINFKMPQCFIK